MVATHGPDTTCCSADCDRGTARHATHKGGRAHFSAPAARVIAPPSVAMKMKVRPEPVCSVAATSAYTRARARVRPNADAVAAAAAAARASRRTPIQRRALGYGVPHIQGGAANARGARRRPPQEARTVLLGRCVTVDAWVRPQRCAQVESRCRRRAVLGQPYRRYGCICCRSNDAPVEPRVRIARCVAVACVPTALGPGTDGRVPAPPLAAASVTPV